MSVWKMTHKIRALLNIVEYIIVNFTFINKFINNIQNFSTDDDDWFQTLFTSITNFPIWHHYHHHHRMCMYKLMIDMNFRFHGSRNSRI